MPRSCRVYKPPSVRRLAMGGPSVESLVGGKHHVLVTQMALLPIAHTKPAWHAVSIVVLPPGIYVVALNGVDFRAGPDPPRTSCREAGSLARESGVSLQIIRGLCLSPEPTIGRVSSCRVHAESSRPG